MAPERLDALAARLASRTPREVVDSERSRAAVALILTGSPDRLLLIRRSQRRDDPWSGQLALPGGRHDPGDGDLFATALRETAEEVGISLDPGQLVARLDDFAPTIRTLPAMLVRPYVFRLESEPEIIVNGEVAATAWTPLDSFADHLGWQTMELAGQRRTVPGYNLPLGLLWGMTERIVTPVITIWQSLPGPEPATG